MPRNGAGVYSKPPGTTAITNTIIDPVPWNSLTTDLGNEITNSLPRDGSAGMVGAFQAANGTNATPSITFVSDTGTGIYRKAASTGAFVSAGAEIASWSPSGFSAVGGISGATITATSGAIGVAGALFGLTLSNNVSDAVNDIDIAAGVASSDATTPFPMVLASILTKRLDANWAVGTNQGGLDTGSIANATYHMFLIQRSDTGVTDVLFSISATSPTMPANYDRKRRIGSIVRFGATILAFTQKGDVFTYAGADTVVSASNPGTSQILVTTRAPTGINVRIFGAAILAINATSGTWLLVITDPAQNPVAGLSNSNFRADSYESGQRSASGWFECFTNTSAQFGYRLNFSDANTGVSIAVFGWIDTRGRI